MTAKERLNAGLETARALIAAGDRPAAAALLDQLGRDQEISALVPQTALGLPRRLHAAHLHLAKAQGDTLRKAGYQFISARGAPGRCYASVAPSSMRPAQR